MSADRLPTLDCACASLRRAARAVTRAYESELRNSKLRVTQFTLLQVLERMGTSPQSALGELLALDSTTLSRTLRPLARAGWIREGKGTDQREVRWSLTPGGRRLLARAKPAWQRAQARLRAGLLPAHWKMLIDDLPTVAAVARKP